MELFFQNIYFRPPQENVLNRLVKNNKGKFGKRRRKQQIIHTFWWIKCRNPNLHQIHNNIKDCRSKYVIFSFRYLFADIFPQTGAHNWDLSICCTGAAAPLPLPLGEVPQCAHWGGEGPLSQKSKIFDSSPTGRAKTDSPQQSDKLKFVFLIKISRC